MNVIKGSSDASACYDCRHFRHSPPTHLQTTLPQAFLPRIGQLTMLQLTLQRLQGLNYPPPVIVGIVNWLNWNNTDQQYSPRATKPETNAVSIRTLSGHPPKNLPNALPSHSIMPLWSIQKELVWSRQTLAGTIWATALLGLLAQNTQGNVQDGDVICQNSNNNHIKGGDRLVAAIGVENLVLVDTSDAPLVTQSNHVEQVKLMIALKLSTPGSLSPLE